MHQLHGDDIGQEYQYYCEEKLSNGLYVWGICSEYKEMTRLLYARLYNAFRFVERLAEHIIHHKSAIVNQLCMGKEFHKAYQQLFGFFSRNVLDSVSEEKQYAMIAGTIPRIMRFVIIKNKH